MVSVDVDSDCAVSSRCLDDNETAVHGRTYGCPPPCGSGAVLPLDPNFEAEFDMTGSPTMPGPHMQPLVLTPSRPAFSWRGSQLGIISANAPADSFQIIPVPVEGCPVQ